MKMTTRSFIGLFSLICFFNALGCDRERSNPVDPQATITSEKPETPQGLRAQPSVNKILLSWQAVRAPDLAGYAVYRARESNGKYLFVSGEGDKTLEITTGKLSFIDSLQIPGQSFFYRVAAVDTFGLRSESSEFVGATSLKDLVSPAMPSNVSVVADSKVPGRIVIRWRRPTLDETGDKLSGLKGYVIFRSEEGNGFEPIDTLGIESREFADVGLRSLVNYSYRILAFDEYGNESQFSIALNAQTIGLSIPNGLKAKSSSDGIEIEWGAVEDPKLFGYVVYRSRRSDTDYVELESVEGSDFTTGQTAYIDSNLQAGDTYFYKVRAIGEGGIFSELSVFVGATVRLDQVAPGPPQNLSAIPSEEFFDRVTLRWNAPVIDSDGKDLSGLEGFVLFRSRGGTSSFVPVDTLDFQEKHYVDEGLESLTTYFYTVSALDGAGNESARASVVQVLTEGPDQVAPGPPQNLSAIADKDDFGQITLTWAGSTQDSDGGQLTGLKGYSVFRSEGSTNSFQRVAEVSLDVREYVDLELSQLTTYFYTVSALDGAGNESARASVVQVRTEGPDQVAPGPPQNLSAIADKDDFGQITLTWNLPTENAIGNPLEDLALIVVFRSENGSGGFSVVDTLDKDQRHFVDMGLSASTEYHYSLSAVDQSGNESLRVNSVSVVTNGPDVLAPASPSNLFVEVAEQNIGIVTLNWDAPKVDEDGSTLKDLQGYFVFRSRGDMSSFKKIAVIGVELVEYEDIEIEDFTAYFYQVSAFDSSGNESARSTAFRIITSGPDRISPATPENLSVFPSEENYGQIELSWDRPKFDAEGESLQDLYSYIIFRSTSANNSMVAIDTVESDVEVYIDTGLVPRRTYFYTITATDGLENESRRATTVSVVAPGKDVVAPSFPTGLYAEAHAVDNQIILTWNAPNVDSDGGDLSGLSDYVLLRSVESGSQFSVIDTISSDETRFVDNIGLLAATEYQYKMQALDIEGNRSLFSGIVSAITAGIEMPRGVAATAGIGQILLSWNSSSEETLLGYNVYRTQRSDTEFERLVGIENTDFSTGKSTFVDSNLVAGSIYFYRISVVTTKGESDLSAFVSATVQLDNRPPNAPSFLEGEAVVGDPEKLDLTWAAPTTDYDGSSITGVALYNVYRADVATGPFEKVAATIVTAYQDTGLSSVTTYYYRVTAVDNFGNSSLNSSSIGVTTSGVARPAGVKISASTPSSLADPPEVTLSWEKSAGAILYYEIERSVIENSNSDEDYTAIGDNTLNTEFVDDTVLRARIYYYRIRARDIDDRVSEWTEIVSVEVKN